MSASSQSSATRDFILREASCRADAARDAEEMAYLRTLMTTLKTVKTTDQSRTASPTATDDDDVDDTSKALAQLKATLQDRIAHLMRRKHVAIAGASGGGDDSDSDSDFNDDDDDAEKDEHKKAAPDLQASQAEWGDFLDASFWREAVEGSLQGVATLEDHEAASISTETVDAARAHLVDTGWAKISASAFPSTHAGDTAAVALAMDALFHRDLPPAFVFLFDEVWRLVDTFWDVAEKLLGAPCTLEPTFAAYRLRTRAEEPKAQAADTTNAKAGGGRYLGTNFGGAHRDYSYTESFTAAGHPRLVTVWVPLVDVDVDSGCMHVVPREFDAHYEGRRLLVPAGEASKPGSLGMHEHRHVCTVGSFSGLSFLHFPLYGSRPLAPVEAGAALMWTGNLIHWGAPYHNKGTKATPRRSIGLVFRRAGASKAAEKGNDCVPITRGEMRGVTASGNVSEALEWRLRRIRQSLGAFTHWHDVPHELKQRLDAFATTTAVEPPQDQDAS